MRISISHLAVCKLVDVVASVWIELDELCEIVDLENELLDADMHFIVDCVLENAADGDWVKCLDVGWFGQEEIAIYFALVDV